MNDPETAPSSPGRPGEGAPEEIPEKPKDRRWFVVLTWITLVAFGIFVAGITLCAVFIPELREAQEGTSR